MKNLKRVAARREAQRNGFLFHCQGS